MAEQLPVIAEIEEPLTWRAWDPPPPAPRLAMDGALRNAAPSGGERASGVEMSLPGFSVNVLLAGVYFLAGKLGLALAIVHPNASAVWAPTGIALTALIGLGYRFWPGIFVGAFLVNVTTAGSIATSLGIATGNTLEALVGAYLVNRFANGWNPFERVRDTVRFTVLAGMIATTVSATIGVLSLIATGFSHGSDFKSVWLTWWLGDLGGALVVSPLLILWINNPRLRWTRAQVLEASLLFLLIVAGGMAVFGTGMVGHPLKFLCMPLLVWAAYRFDQRIASTALLLLAATAVTGTLRSTGGLQKWELNESLVMLQVFMGVASMSTLAFAAVVSERRRVEAKIRATSEQLREAIAELEAFSRSISHDLRSPIGAVMNFSAMLEEEFHTRLETEGLRMVHGIQASAESAVSLLDQLAQFAWAGREKGEKLHVDMTSLAQDAHGELVTGAGAGDIHFEFRDLPPAWGSPALLRCVFRNLISNAVKYTRGREVRCVQVGGESGARENTYWVLDNGIGFDPTQIDALFRPFQRLSGARHIEGSGLGLAIVERIVRNHGGRVWGESDGSNGARFCFTLPDTMPDESDGVRGT